MLLDKPPSTKERPTHSNDVAVCIPPKGKGKSKGDGGKGKNGIGGKGDAPQKRERNSSVGKGRGSAGSDAGSAKSSSPANVQTVWQRRAAAAAAVDGEPAVDGAEGVDLSEKMDTVQAMLNSRAGREDDYSLATRKQLDAEMSALRIKKTQLKPLTAQVSVLEALVGRRQASVAMAEATLTEAQQKLDTLRQDLCVATAQLASVKEAAAKEDAMKTRGAPNTNSVIDQATQMSSLLPPDKAAAFAECLSLLSQLVSGKAPDVTMNATAPTTQLPGLQEANRDTEVLDVEAPAGADAVSGHGHGLQAVDGSQDGALSFGAVAQRGKGAVHRDPYGSPPPRQGRAMSVPASPAERRSRSTSRTRPRCKQPAPWEGLQHYFSQPIQQGTEPG